MKNVLVVGGAGYIGSHVCKALFLNGFTPVVFDNLVYGHSSSVKWGPLEIGDIGDKAKLDYVLNKYQPIAVMHFATYAYVGESVSHPSKYYNNNIGSTLVLLDSILEAGINSIIFSSSCATYGVPEVVPITETHPQKPINPYGFTKYVVERVLQDYFQAYGLCSVSLRYFNAAGADADTEIGEYHIPETHLIPLTIAAALDSKKYIKVFGTDYDTPDGTCIRDYIHVTDIADAHVRSMNRLLNTDSVCSFYNLGNEKGFSVKEIVNKCQDIIGCKINILDCDRRIGDPPILIGSYELIKKELGWEPLSSNIDNILQTANNWHKRNVI